MYNVLLDYEGQYVDIRRRMMDKAHGILEQNRRAFIKATRFPYVCVKDRVLGDLGSFKISVVAESKSRLKMGIVGVSAFKVFEVPDEDGNNSGYYSLLHFEYNDDSSHFLYYLLPTFIEDYVKHRFGKGVKDVPVDTVIKSFVKDSYWGSNGHLMLSPDKGLSSPLEDTLINNQPCWGVSFVIESGVCFGFENKAKNIQVYFAYKREEDVNEYSNEDLAKVHDLMDAKRRDFDNNPWLYSPLAANLNDFDHNTVN